MAWAGRGESEEQGDRHLLARCPYEADQGVMMTVGTTDMIAGTELTADSAGLPSVSTTYLQGVVDFGVRCGLSARALLLRVFGVPVHFGSGRNAMLLDPSYLLTDLTPGPSHVTRILAAHANAQLAELEKRKSCRGRLEVELRKVLHTGNVGIAQVTRRLSMTATRVWLRSGCGKALFESLNQRTSKQSLRR